MANVPRDTLWRADESQSQQGKPQTRPWARRRSRAGGRAFLPENHSLTCLQGETETHARETILKGSWANALSRCQTKHIVASTLPLEEGTGSVTGSYEMDVATGPRSFLFENPKIQATWEPCFTSWDPIYRVPQCRRNLPRHCRSRPREGHLAQAPALPEEQAAKGMHKSVPLTLSAYVGYTASISVGYPRPSRNAGPRSMA